MHAHKCNLKLYSHIKNSKKKKKSEVNFNNIFHITQHNQNITI